VSRGQSRSLYVIATFASISIILLGGMLIMLLAGLLAVFVEPRSQASRPATHLIRPFFPAPSPSF